MPQTNTPVTEIVSFKTISGITENRLVEIVNNLDMYYLRTTTGYMDAELLKGKEDDSWIFVIHWRTLEEANEGIREFVSSPLTEEYRSILDPESVDLHFTEQVQSWQVAR